MTSYICKFNFILFVMRVTKLKIYLKKIGSYPYSTKSQLHHTYPNHFYTFSHFQIINIHNAIYGVARWRK